MQCSRNNRAHGEITLVIGVDLGNRGPEGLGRLCAARRDVDDDPFPITDDRLKKKKGCHFCIGHQ
jgi:hypothetical protein